MAISVSADRIRLSCTGGKNQSIPDRLTAASPGAFVGNDWRIEVSLEDNSGNLADISNVSTLTFDIKPLASRNQLPLLDGNVLSSGDLNVSLSQSQWDSLDPTLAHGIFKFTKDQTKLIQLNSDSQDFFFAIYANTTDSPSKKVTWCIGTITLVSDGSGVAAPSYVVQPTYLTEAQADSRYAGGSTSGKANKSGDTITGPFLFTGTTYAAIQLNALTTTNVNAIGSPAAGMFTYNDTTRIPTFYNGSAWKTFVTKITANSTDYTGDVTLDTSNFAEVTNLFYTDARVRACVLTGINVSTTGAVSATDTVLQAIGKLQATKGIATVSSVALTGIAGLINITGSPITSTGTLALALPTNTTSNQVFAGPATGSTGTPLFRALVALDIPNIAESQVVNLTADLAALLPLGGGTVTGNITLPSGVQTGLQAISRTSADSLYWGITGTVTSNATLVLGGTITVSSIISCSTTPTSSSHLVNMAYAYPISGGVAMTGLLSFSGTSNAGLKLANLNGIGGIISPTSGMLVFNSAAGVKVPWFYDGSSWVSLASGSSGTIWITGTDTSGSAGAPGNSIGINGNFYLNTSNGNIFIKSAGSWASTSPPKLSLTGGTLSSGLAFVAALSPAIDFGNRFLFNSQNSSGNQLVLQNSGTNFIVADDSDGTITIGDSIGGTYLNALNFIKINGTTVLKPQVADVALPSLSGPSANETAILNYLTSLRTNVIRYHGLTA